MRIRGRLFTSVASFGRQRQAACQRRHPAPEHCWNKSVKQQLGFLLQLGVLGFLPALVVYQLYFGIPLIVMPAMLLAGIVVFIIGMKLRESD